MLMGAQFVGIDGLEFSKVCIGAAIVAFVVEALEMVRDVGDAGALGQTDTLAFADDRGGVTLALIGEEVVKSDAEDHGDAKQRGQSGIEFVALKLGKERGGESSVLAELDEAHAFLEAKGTEFRSDLVGP